LLPSARRSQPVRLRRPQVPYRVRALFIGLTYAFGGPGKPVNKDFDFGQPPAK
jgi:hypothetical protein